MSERSHVACSPTSHRHRELLSVLDVSGVKALYHTLTGVHKDLLVGPRTGYSQSAARQRTVPDTDLVDDGNRCDLHHGHSSTSS